MKALYKSSLGNENLELIERPFPEMDETNNVLIKVKACAVCGMDHRIYHGTYPCTPPFIIGHELIGVIDKKLGSVENFDIGDRVTIQPHLYSCGKCAPCSMGLTQFCKEKRSVGIDRDGAMTSYVVVPAKCLHHVPVEISDSLATIIEPFSMIYGNIVPVVRKTKAKTVVIIGAGQVGMLALVGAKAAGAENVLVSGVTKDIDYRFEVAKKLGATETIDSMTSSIQNRVMELTNGVGADVVLDASGSESGIADGIKALRHGGTLISMGMTRKENISVCWDVCIKKALHIDFCMQSNYQYMDEAIRFMAHPYADLSPLITKEGKLSEWRELFDYMDSHDTLKNVIYIDC